MLSRTISQYVSAAFLSLGCLTSTSTNGQTNPPVKADSVNRPSTNTIPDLRLITAESPNSFPLAYQRNLLGKVAESRLLMTLSDSPYEEMRKIGESTLRRSALQTLGRTETVIKARDFLQEKAIDPVNDFLSRVTPIDVNIRLGLDFTKRTRLYEEPFLTEEKIGGKFKINLGSMNVSYQVQLFEGIRVGTTLYHDQMRLNVSIPLVDHVRIEGVTAIPYKEVSNFQNENRSSLSILKRSRDGSFAYGLQARTRGSESDRSSSFGDRGSSEKFDSVMFVGSFDW